MAYFPPYHGHTPLPGFSGPTELNKPRLTSPNLWFLSSHVGLLTHM